MLYTIVVNVTAERACQQHYAVNYHYYYILHNARMFIMVPYILMVI